MSKNTEKKRTSFWEGLLIAAGISLVVIAVGLGIFWAFISAFENSRPQTTIANYMEQLTVQQLIQLDKETMKKLDTSIQSEEEAVAYAENALQKITYAKNTKLSTDTKQVYMILNAGKSLGSVTMTVVNTDAFGFDYWAVTETDIDVSFLLGEQESVTVPANYRVYANGVLLDSDYVTDFGIHYTGLEEYYKKYSEMPTLYTFTSGAIFGTPRITVTDAAGNALSPEELAAAQHLPDNCSNSKKEELTEFVETYLYYYVRLTMAAGGQWKLTRNYNALLPYVKEDTNLSTRLKDSLEGLSWVLDRRAQITDLKIHAIVYMGDDHYLCDFSYVVDGTTYEGPIRNEANVKLVIDDTDNGLKAESMTNY